jgi:hypothetical protein
MSARPVAGRGAVERMPNVRHAGQDVMESTLDLHPVHRGRGLAVATTPSGDDHGAAVRIRRRPVHLRRQRGQPGVVLCAVIRRMGVRTFIATAASPNVSRGQKAQRA